MYYFLGSINKPCHSFNDFYSFTTFINEFLLKIPLDLYHAILLLVPIFVLHIYHNPRLVPKKFLPSSFFFLDSYLFLCWQVAFIMELASCFLSVPVELLLE